MRLHKYSIEFFKIMGNKKEQNNSRIQITPQATPLIYDAAPTPVAAQAAHRR
jgi:hypothetical protein